MLCNGLIVVFTENIIMSWDSYIDNLIGHAGASNCDRACIIGIDGSAWTTTSHACAMNMSGTEVANIARCFKSKDFTSLMASGVMAESVKYQFLREDEGKLVLAKKKDHGALVLGATKTAVVIAHTPEGGQQGKTNQGVCVIVDYLESLNM